MSLVGRNTLILWCAIHKLNGCIACFENEWNINLVSIRSGTWCGEPLGSLDTHLPVIFSPHQPFSYDNRRTLIASTGAFSPLADCCFSTIVTFFPYLELKKAICESVKIKTHTNCNTWTKWTCKIWNIHRRSSSRKFSSFEHINFVSVDSKSVYSLRVIYLV